MILNCLLPKLWRSGHHKPKWFVQSSLQPVQIKPIKTEHFSVNCMWNALTTPCLREQLQRSATRGQQRTQQESPLMFPFFRSCCQFWRRNSIQRECWGFQDLSPESRFNVVCYLLTLHAPFRVYLTAFGLCSHFFKQVNDHIYYQWNDNNYTLIQHTNWNHNFYLFVFAGFCYDLFRPLNQ